MCQRKSWTKMEDRILKLLHQQRGYKKWSDVAEIMRTQYGIQGRNGKQCRQRYHNHLDQRISKSEWSFEEDQTLLKLHNQLGNRWALIARQIKGRTDNCVKNRFYSRFRRSIRNVNALIKIFWKKQFKQLKPTFISKVIQITQQFRVDSQNGKKQLSQACEGTIQCNIVDLKSRLMKFSDVTEQHLVENQQGKKSLFELIKQINQFNRKNKRKSKKKKKQCSDCEDEQDFWSQQKQKDIKKQGQKIPRRNANTSTNTMGSIKITTNKQMSKVRYKNNQRKRKRQINQSQFSGADVEIKQEEYVSESQYMQELSLKMQQLEYGNHGQQKQQQKNYYQKIPIQIQKYYLLQNYSQNFNSLYSFPQLPPNRQLIPNVPHSHHSHCQYPSQYAPKPSSPSPLTQQQKILLATDTFLEHAEKNGQIVCPDRQLCAGQCEEGFVCHNDRNSHNPEPNYRDFQHYNPEGEFDINQFYNFECFN